MLLACTKEITATEIVGIVESIVSFQLHNHKSVEIHGMDCTDSLQKGFSVPEYRIILSSSLTRLLRQPQFHSLSGKCLLPEAFELMETP